MIRPKLAGEISFPKLFFFESVLSMGVFLSMAPKGCESWVLYYQSILPIGNLNFRKTAEGNDEVGEGGGEAATLADMCQHLYLLPPLQGR